MAYETMEAMKAAKAEFAYGQDAPMRSTQVRAEMEILGNAVCNVGDVVSGLEERLGLLLRPVAGQERNPQIEKTVEPMVPFADEIRSQRIRIDAIAGRLHMLLDRLEI